MKRSELLRFLVAQGYELLREVRRHSWWHHPELNTRSAIPRHSEINDHLAHKICKYMGVKPIP